MPTQARPLLQAAYDDGIRSLAIVFMHGYRFPAHEEAVGGAGARDRFHANFDKL